MKIQLIKARRTAFILTIFFISFSNFKQIIPGEIFGEASYYFLFVFLGFELLNIEKRNKLVFTKTIYNYEKFVFIIFCFILISFLFNLKGIFSNNYKQQLGITRFIWQTIIFILTFGVQVFFFFNFYKDFKINEIKTMFLKAINYSFNVISFFGFFQYLSSYLKINLFVFINWINLVPFFKIEPIEGISRMMVFSREPSFFANYLIFIFPFLMLQLKEQQLFSNYFKVFFCVVLVFLSDSRIGLVILVFQGIFYLKENYRDHKKKILIIVKIFNKIILIFLAFVTLLFFTHKGTNKFITKKIERFNPMVKTSETTSNSTRYYSTAAGVKIGIENPVFGVGLGQVGFQICDKVSLKALKNNYELRMFNCNCNQKIFPLAYNLFVRIFSELGIIGLSLFVFFFLFLFKIINQVRKKSKKSSENEFVSAVFICFCSLFIFSLQIDTFRYISLWLIVSLILYLNEYDFKTIN